jgi:hypothetical protein
MGMKRVRLLRIIATCSIALGLALFGGAVHSETDVLLRAVGFALTGSDDAEPKVVGNRVNCVFAITKTSRTSSENDVFYLNNVQTDRIKIQGWERKNPNGGIIDQWVKVELHGDEVVFENTWQTIDDGSDYFREIRKQDPTFFQPHHSTNKEYELSLTTNDQARVTRAWQYIYSHGCTGKQSPF